MDTSFPSLLEVLHFFKNKIVLSNLGVLLPRSTEAKAGIVSEFGFYSEGNEKLLWWALSRAVMCQPVLEGPVQ